MRIDILAIGSRGDVQPFVALGLGLRGAGHRVRLVTLAGFEELVCGQGLDHLPIGSNPLEIANTDAGQKWIKDRSSTLGFLRGFVRVAGSRIEEGMRRYWNSCHDAEALIVSPMGLLVGVHIAERLRAPLIQAQVEPPSVRTRYDWNGRKNLSTAVSGNWRAFLDAGFHLLLWSALRQSTNAARRDVLDLPSLSLTQPLTASGRKRPPLLCGFSPAVVPKPPDFDDWIHHTGYWFLDDHSGWKPPDELVDFLKAGPPPVFVGLGSTPFPQPEATTDLVMRALSRINCRGILVAGGSGIRTGRLSHEILSVNSAPYGWLFPWVQAVVHQGGAGVTGAALRAGLPSVVVPVFGVHSTWGNRLFELGAAPKPIPAKHLTEENLADAIRATADSAMRGRAAALGEKIRREDGVGRAVTIIHECIGKGALQDLHQHAH